MNISVSLKISERFWRFAIHRNRTGPKGLPSPLQQFYQPCDHAAARLVKMTRLQKGLHIGDRVSAWVTCVKAIYFLLSVIRFLQMIQCLYSPCGTREYTFSLSFEQLANSDCKTPAIFLCSIAKVRKLLATSLW